MEESGKKKKLQKKKDCRLTCHSLENVKHTHTVTNMFADKIRLIRMENISQTEAIFYLLDDFIFHVAFSHNFFFFKLNLCLRSVTRSVCLSFFFLVE